MTPEKDHDILIRIDENLRTLLAEFAAHEKDDKEKFGEHDKRINKLENVYWIGIGVIIVVELILKLGGPVWPLTEQLGMKQSQTTQTLPAK